MQEFFASGILGEDSLRTPPAEAHRDIFLLCKQILCSEHKDVHRSLRIYAAGEWIYHLSWSGTNEYVAQADKIAVLQALAAIMTNTSNVSTVFEELDVDYDNQLWAFSDDLFSENLSFLSKLGVELAEELPANMREWYQQISEDVHRAFVPLAKAHVANWFKAESPRAVLQSYRFARQCMKLVSILDLGLMEMVVAASPALTLDYAA